MVLVLLPDTATAAENGLKHEECTDCGYKKTAVEIPATGTTDPDDPDNPDGLANSGGPTTPDNPNGPNDPNGPANPDDPATPNNPSGFGETNGSTGSSGKIDDANSNRPTSGAPQIGDHGMEMIWLFLMVLIGTGLIGHRQYTRITSPQHHDI